MKPRHNVTVKPIEGSHPAGVRGLKQRLGDAPDAPALRRTPQGCVD